MNDLSLQFDSAFVLLNQKLYDEKSDQVATLDPSVSCLLIPVSGVFPVSVPCLPVFDTAEKALLCRDNSGVIEVANDVAVECDYERLHQIIRQLSPMAITINPTGNNDAGNARTVYPTELYLKALEVHLD